MSDWEKDFSDEYDRHSFVRAAERLPPPPQSWPGGETPTDGRVAPEIEWRPELSPSPEDPTNYFVFDWVWKSSRPTREGVFTRGDGSTVDAIEEPHELSIPAWLSNEVPRAFWTSRRPPTRLPDCEHIGAHTYLVSQAFLQPILSLDPEAILHQRLEYRFQDGSSPAAPVHLMMVRRKIWGVDADRSVLRFGAGTRGRKEDGDRIVWCPHGTGAARFRTDLPYGCHIFRQLRSVFYTKGGGGYAATSWTAISSELTDTWRTAKPKLTGWQWRHPASEFGWRTD